MKISKFIYSLMAAATMLLTACSPDDYSLGGKDLTAADLAQGIAYTVTIDQATNTVQLTSLLDSKYTVLWTHPQGRSQAGSVTLRIPFGGDYEVTFGVETRGGVVYGEPYSFTLNNTNPDLLTDELWTLISGGVNQEKTWVIDLDENGISKYFSGPLYFFGTDDNWDTAHGAAAPEGADSWNWNADWAGNTWITDAKNFGTMTFDLKNGAHVTVSDLDNGRNYSGTYLLDPENHTISLSDAQILHLSSYDAIVTNWRSNLKLFSLTEHTMQIAALRDNSDEGPCLLVFNFISQEAYNDPSLLPTEGGNEHFQEQSVTDPTFSGLNDQLAVTTFTSLTYKINEDAPYDWLWWNGAVGAWESNGFSDKSQYPSWAPIPDGYDEIALTLEKTSDNGGEYTAVIADGSEVAGKYTLSDNKLVFDQEINFLTASTNRVKPVEIKGTTFYVMSLDREEGTLQLGVPDGKNANGVVNQYVILNLIAQPIGGGETGPTKLLFDNSKFFYGDIEGNGNFRLELCNQYGFNGGQTYNDPPFNASKLKFKQELSITFSISGLGTLTEAAKATIGCSIDWKFDGSADADDSGIKHVNADVTGDGTYTVKLQSDGTKYTSANLNVFVIDILNVAGKLDGKDSDYIAADGETGKCPNVSVTVTEMTVE